MTLRMDTEKYGGRFAASRTVLESSGEGAASP
jgi:hypothetical protein